MKLSESKRLQILNAALIEFQSRGFKSSNMDSISKLADVSKRTVYNHFSSKNELFVSVVFHSLEQMRSVDSADFDPTVSIKKQLTRIALSEIRLLQSEQLLPFARMLMTESIDNPKMAQLLESKRPSFEAQFDHWLKDAVKQGSLSITDYDTAIQQFFSILKGSAFWPAVLQMKTLSKKQATELAQSTASMFLNSYAKAP